eukprot:c20850_g1_i1.p1 GENE.c20850_g1_i1~~c20850_g1_i1.p1  ORF type:complete len:591 (+),score=139.49 c20850_g1_i1:66-1838(+)
MADSSDATKDEIISRDKRIQELEEQVSRLSEHLRTPSIVNRELEEHPRVAEIIAESDPKVLAVTVNGEIMAISAARNTHSSAKVEPVTLESSGGISIYRQTLSFVAGMAANIAFPGHTLRTEHAFGLESSEVCTAYYCEISKLDQDTQLSMGPDEIHTLRKTMENIVASNFEIEVCSLNAPDVLQAFERQNMPYAHTLIDSMNTATVVVNRCQGYLSPHIVPLAHLTGVLDQYRIEPYGNGLVLLFPSPLLPLPNGPPPSPHAIHEQWRWDNARWNVLNLGCVGDINKVVVEGDSGDLVHLGEAQQDKEIMELAQRIAQKQNTKLVLIGGPSSSGKTTFAAKLVIHLRLLGLRPMAISVDDYYRDITWPSYPRTAEGKLDFENIQALRLDLLNTHLNALMRGEEVEMPVFDFKLSRPKEKGVRRKMPSGGIIVAEGIFCLNPQLTAQVDDDKKFKLYMAPMSQLNLDEHSFFSNQRLRVLRRICRDKLFRNRNAEQTIQQWAAVRLGEEKNLFPFMTDVDAVFNSSLAFELPVISVFALPLLRTVSPNSPAFRTARQLIAFLEFFEPIPAQHISSTSILREFIGGSSFDS